MLLYNRLHPLKWLALFFYTALCFIQRPGWCLRLEMTGKMESSGPEWWSCQPKNKNIPVNTYVFLPSWVTNTVFILCEVILASFLEFRKNFRSQSTNQVKIERVTIFLAGIAILDYIKCLIAVPLRCQNTFLLFPWLASFIRPWELIIMITILRSFWIRYWNVMKHTFPMVVLMMAYVFYYSYLGFRMFAGTIEGGQSFDSMDNSFWNMFVLLTTANFPDIMLPSYKENAWTALFFISYLIFGLWLLMNLFLAIFYSRY